MFIHHQPAATADLHILLTYDFKSATAPSVVHNSRELKRWKIREREIREDFDK